MKEFIYLDTDYLTSALAQLNNGKILTYSNEGATTSTDESKKTSSSQNTSKVNFGLPKVIGVNFGNDKTSEDSSAFIDIKSLMIMLLIYFLNIYKKVMRYQIRIIKTEILLY